MQLNDLYSTFNPGLAGTENGKLLTPATGIVIGNELITHKGGTRINSTTKYAIDIALRMKKIYKK